MWESVKTPTGLKDVRRSNTLAGSLLYYFEAWVGDQVGQEVILEMDFMVPAGIRLDLADGTLCLPDEVRISLAGRRPPYQSTMQAITARDQHVVIPVGVHQK